MASYMGSWENMSKLALQQNGVVGFSAFDFHTCTLVLSLSAL
jgi:hypothetical protein